MPVIIFGTNDSDRIGPTIFGTDPGFETSNGTDKIFGNGGDDQICAQDGRDEIFGGSGDDLIDGGEGNDFINGDGFDNNGKGLMTPAVDGDDSINGGGGNDSILGEGGNDTIHGETGNDTIDSGMDDDCVTGGGGKDVITAGGGDDTVEGGTENDTITGNAGDDQLCGGTGNDSIDGGTDDDTIHGEGDNDSLVGDGGDDAISGGNGKDTISGGVGNDTLSGGNGKDVVSGDSGHDDISGGAENDTISGGTGADTLRGGAGNDRIDLGDDKDQDILVYTEDEAPGNDIVFNFDCDDKDLILLCSQNNVGIVITKNQVGFNGGGLASESDALIYIATAEGTGVITLVDAGDCFVSQGPNSDGTGIVLNATNAANFAYVDTHPVDGDDSTPGFTMADCEQEDIPDCDPCPPIFDFCL